MNLAVVGTGYVGLVTGTCLAEMGNDVVCVDVDAEKVAQLQAGEIPIYEPGLGELIEANTLEGRLRFTTDLGAAIATSQIIMIAVGTPAGDNGAADLSAVYSVVEEVARTAPGPRVLVTKSTVPVGTTEKLTAHLRGLGREDITLVSNPEFLKQGDAVNDFLKPDRVVIGADDAHAAQLMQELYAPFLRTGNRLIMMDICSAEMTKYVANAFLATKISFMNEMSRVCERVGADIELIRAGISSDSRIGDKFLFPGLGFGGSCFPKDVKALIATGETVSESLPILRGVCQVNEQQRLRFCQRILEFFDGEVEGRTLALWGLAFKPRTDDIREAPALTIIDFFLERGASLQVFDPRAMGRVRQLYGDRLTYCELAYEAVKDADALVIATEWNEFRRPDFERVRQALKQPVIFDGRNLYTPERMQQRGFEYYCIGR
jgi:UDPglucose 6-dehydrogenase